MRRYLALIPGAVLVLSPLEGVTQEKKIVDVKELAGTWRGWVTRERGHEPVMMMVSADGSYRAMTADTASTEGKFYLQDGKLRYRSSRTIGTASLSVARGNSVLTMVPEEFVYRRTGRAEYERVE
jgi:hypothetical protein